MGARRTEKAKHRTWAGLAGLALSLALIGCGGLSARDFLRGYAEGRADALAAYENAALTPAQRGAVAFALSDFGALNTDTLETHAVPWRLAAAALALKEAEAQGGAVSAARIAPIMQRFGFIYPTHIGNWPEGLAQPLHLNGARALEAPMGLSLGVVARDVPRIRLTSANLACASCHAGVSYDEEGRAITEVAYLGAPNTSLDLEAYVQAVYAAFRDADEAQLLSAVRTIFPDTSDAEMATLRQFVMPRVRARIAALEQTGGRPLPFVNGAAGLTNGVAALRMQMGLLPADAYARERGFTSIPDLGARGFRAMLLYDGAYAPLGEGPRAIARADINAQHIEGLAIVTAFFTVPSMGVHPDRAAAHLGEANDVFAFLDGYEAPRFPGRIDAGRAAQGRALYAGRCASCHGVYDDNLERPALLSFPNWIGDVGTDPVRAGMFDAATAEAVRESAYGARINAQANGRYAAPLLTGLWLSAPYLHNGAVPTLWHLMHPDARPQRFQTGGHALDFSRMGVAGEQRGEDYLYAEDYQPWAQPTLIDTRARGLSNAGHAAEFEGLSEAEKSALIEYLKLL